MLAVAASSVGCANRSDSASSRPRVVVSFAPLAWAAEAIGGDAIDVVDLTPPGVEPHDLELAPSQIAAVGDADLVIVLGGGFQPAVEDAAADALVLMDQLDLDSHAEDDGHVDDEDHDHGGVDPHVWLDPILMQHVVEIMAVEIAARVPDSAEEVAANADALVAELAMLDEEARVALDRCARRELVTAHDAFGRLAGRYGLRAIPIAGISPDVEPSPARLAEIAELVRDYGVTTIFAETLVSPEIAETLADEAGGLTIARLDPIEGFTDAQRDSGVTYLDVMRDNLASIAVGLDCT